MADFDIIARILDAKIAVPCFLVFFSSYSYLEHASGFLLVIFRIEAQILADGRSTGAATSIRLNTGRPNAAVMLFGASCGRRLSPRYEPDSDIMSGVNYWNLKW